MTQPEKTAACLENSTLRFLLAVLSAGLLTLSFATPPFAWFAWCALIPLIVALHGGGVTAAFGLGWLCGIVGAFGVFRWFFSSLADGVGWPQAILLAVYLGIYLSAWAVGVMVLGRSRFPIVLSSAGLWVSLEYLRSQAGFLAVPMGTLAQTQHANLPLLQSASVVGEYGISFLIVAVNVSIARWLMFKAAFRPMLSAFFLAAVVHVLGMARLAPDESNLDLVVSIVQPNIRTNETRSISGNHGRHERLETLTRRAAQDNPDLIVWPESAVLNLTRFPGRVNRVQSLSDELETPILLGTSEFEKFQTTALDRSVRLRSYNSAYLVTPDSLLSEPYRKILLLPFAEYLPLARYVSWPDWLVPRFFESAPGHEPQSFQLHAKQRFSVIICWENLFSDFVRKVLRGESQFLVHISNDGWFRDPALAIQHNAASVMRAVENRVVTLVASNTGPSQIIDAYGRIVAVTPYAFQAGHITAAVSPDGIRSFYSRYGNVFLLFAFAFVGAGFMPVAGFWLHRIKTGREGYGFVTEQDEGWRVSLLARFPIYRQGESYV